VILKDLVLRGVNVATTRDCMQVPGEEIETRGGDGI
jgi:hypothetical protein